MMEEEVKANEMKAIEQVLTNKTIECTQKDITIANLQIRIQELEAEVKSDKEGE